MQLHNMLLDCYSITEKEKTRLKGVKEVGVQKARNIFVDVCDYTPSLASASGY